MQENPGKDSGSLSVSNKRLLFNLKAYSLLIVLSIIWGIAFVAIKAVEPVLDPVNLTLLRWLIASAGFLVIAPFLGRSKTKFERADLPRLIGVSFANVVSYHLTLNYSERTISAGLAGLIVALGPVFIFILSWIFLNERHGRNFVLIVLLAFSGAVILSIDSLFTGIANSFYGILEAVGTALSYAVFAVFSKPLVQKYGPRPFTIWAGLIGTVMLLPLLSSSFVSQVSHLPLIDWLSMLYLSLLSTVIGYMMFYTLVRRGAVSRLSIQLYLIPVISVIGGILILGETITVFTVIGGLILLSAVGLSSTKKNR